MKVLLVDTAFAALPIYDYLIEQDHEVWVIGNRPHDVLAQRAGERWIAQDYSAVDEVEAICDRLGIDRVVPGCTDVSILTALRLSAMGGRADSPETYSKLHFKDSFRKVCADLDLPAPRSVAIDTFPRKGRYAVKPTNAFSGRGVSVVDGQDMRALRAAYAEAQGVGGGGDVLVEDFVEGQMYSCSGFVEAGKLVRCWYVIEGSSVNPFAVDTSRVVVDVPKQITSRLESSLGMLCEGLGLADGLLHTQFILTPDGPSIIEVSRRCPGDLYALLIAYSIGIPYAGHYASYFLGVAPPAWEPSPRHILRHTVTAAEGGLNQGLRMPSAYPVRACFPLMPVGGQLLPRQGNRAGLLFCEFQTADELSRAYESFLSRQSYEIA